MSTKDFLVELGTEELPPKALKGLSESFRDGIVAGLKASGLAHGEVKAFAAPRRLAVCVDALATQQPDRSIAVDGLLLKRPLMLQAIQHKPRWALRRKMALILLRSTKVAKSCAL